MCRIRVVSADMGTMWTSRTSVSDLRVSILQRLLYHGGATDANPTLYYATVEYINTEKSSIRLRYLPSCAVESVRGKQEGWSALSCFHSFDVAFTSGTLENARPRHSHQANRRVNRNHRFGKT